MWVRRLLEKIDARLPSRRFERTLHIDDGKLTLLQNGAERQRFNPEQIQDVFGHRRELYMDDCVSLVIHLDGGDVVEIDEGSPGWRDFDRQLALLMGREVNEHWYFEALESKPGKRVEVFL